MAMSILNAAQNLIARRQAEKDELEKLRAQQAKAAAIQDILVNRAIAREEGRSTINDSRSLTALGNQSAAAAANALMNKQAQKGTAFRMNNANQQAGGTGYQAPRANQGSLETRKAALAELMRQTENGGQGRRAYTQPKEEEIYLNPQPYEQPKKQQEEEEIHILPGMFGNGSQKKGYQISQPEEEEIYLDDRAFTQPKKQQEEEEEISILPGIFDNGSQRQDYQAPKQESTEEEPAKPLTMKDRRLAVETLQAAEEEGKRAKEELNRYQDGTLEEAERNYNNAVADALYDRYGVDVRDSDRHIDQGKLQAAMEDEAYQGYQTDRTVSYWRDMLEEERNLQGSVAQRISQADADKAQAEEIIHQTEELQAKADREKAGYEAIARLEEAEAKLKDAQQGQADIDGFIDKKTGLSDVEQNYRISVANAVKDLYDVDIRDKDGNVDEARFQMVLLNAEPGLKYDGIWIHGDTELARQRVEESKAYQERVNEEKKAAEEARQQAELDLNNNPEVAEIYNKYNNPYWNNLIDPISVNVEEMKQQAETIRATLNAGRYNQAQAEYAESVLKVMDRNILAAEDPERTAYILEEERDSLQALLDSENPYWLGKQKEIESRIKLLNRQIILENAADLRAGNDAFKAKADNGKAKYLEAIGSQEAKLLAPYEERANKGTAFDLYNIERAEGETDESYQARLDNAKLQYASWMLYQSTQGRVSDTTKQLLNMTEAQRDQYYYLYNEDPEGAAEYLEAIKPVAAQQQADTERQILESQSKAVPVTMALTSIAAEGVKPVAAAYTMIDNVVLGNEKLANSRGGMADQLQSTIRETQKEAITEYAEKNKWPAWAKKAATFGYDLVMQIGDNLWRSRVGYGMGIVNPGLSTGLMSFGAAGSTLNQKLDEGVDTEQAVLLAGIDGLAEFITEKWSDANLFKGIEEGAKGFMDLLKSGAQSAVMESWTEVASDLISLVGSQVVQGDEGDYSKLIDEYYYQTGDIEQARKMAFKDQMSAELYTLLLSGASGGMMDVSNRLITNTMRSAEQKRLDRLTPSAQTNQGENAEAQAEPAAEAIEEAEEVAAPEPMSAEDRAALGEMAYELRPPEGRVQEQREQMEALNREESRQAVSETELEGVTLESTQAPEGEETAEERTERLTKRFAVMGRERGMNLKTARELAEIRGTTLDSAKEKGQTVETTDDEYYDAAEALMDELTGAHADIFENQETLYEGLTNDMLDPESNSGALDEINNPLIADLSAQEKLQIVDIAQKRLRDQAKAKLAATLDAARRYGFQATDRSAGEMVTGTENEGDEGKTGVVLMDVGGEELDGATVVDNTEPLDDEQVAQLKVLDEFNKKLQEQGLNGIQIRVWRRIINTGRRLNGSYKNDGSTKEGAAVVNIALDSEGNNLLRSAGHELYHMIETWNRPDALKLREYVLSALQNTEGYDLEARRRELGSIYKKGTDIDSEIVADSMFDVLNDEELIKRTVSQSRTLGERIADLIGKIKNAFSALTDRITGSKETRALKKQQKALEEIRAMWQRGVEGALIQQQAAGEVLNDTVYGVKDYYAANEEARSGMLQDIAGALTAKTQGAVMDGSDANFEETRAKLNKAVRAYADGKASLNAALTQQGLEGVEDAHTRAVMAWYGRELNRPAKITKGATLSEFASERTDLLNSLIEFDKERTGDGDYVGAIEYLIDAAHGLPGHVNGERVRAERLIPAGAWKSRLAQTAQELIVDAESDIDQQKVERALAKLYRAMDNENDLDVDGALRYAKRIAEDIVKKSRALVDELSEDEKEALSILKGATIALSDVTSRQYKNHGQAVQDRIKLARKLTGKNRWVLNGVAWKPRSGALTADVVLEESEELKRVLGLTDPTGYGVEEIEEKLFAWLDDVHDRKYAVVTDDQVRGALGYLPAQVFMGYFNIPNAIAGDSVAVKNVKAEAKKQIEDIKTRHTEQLNALRMAMLEAQKAGADKARQEQQALQDYMQKRFDNYKDREKVLKYRGSIEKSLNKMRQLLLNPTKTKHMQEQFRGGIAAALKLVDTSSVVNPDSIRTYDWNQLMAAIAADQQEDGYSMVVDPDLMEDLKELAETANGVPLMSMDSTQLEQVDKVLKSIFTTLNNADKLFTQGQKAGIEAISEPMIEGLNKSEAKKERKAGVKKAITFLDTTMADPVRMFERLERYGGAGKLMWSILRGGLDTHARLNEEAKKRMAEAVGNSRYEQWTGKNDTAQTFELSNGQTIDLTQGQVMTLYLLNKRGQARQHIYSSKGGIVAGRAEAKNRIVKGTEAMKVNDRDVNNIIGSLSQEQKDVADRLQGLMAGWCSDLGNKVSMQLYGYKKFKEKGYFPIKVWGGTLGVSGTELEQQRKTDSLYAITNKGFTKDLNKKASNPLELNNVFDVALDHLAGMITYASWAVPMTDVTRILNYKSENGTVINSINRAMGNETTAYLVQLMRNINGLSADPVEKSAQGITRLFRNFKAAAVGFNLSTVAKQGLSIVRAFDVIPAHYFVTPDQVKRFEKGEDGRKIDELMTKYAPIYAWKQDGRFTMDTGKDLKATLLPKTSKVTDRITEFGMKAAGAADNMTWHSIWIAAEKLIQATTDLQKGTEEYYQAVGDKFSECIDKTQVVDSILHRTEVMRSNSMWVKMGTSFMGEPLKTWNQLADAVRALSEKNTPANRKRVIRTGLIMGASAALQATVASFIQALRHWGDGDEELEELFKKYLLGEYGEDDTPYKKVVEILFGNNLAQELNPINYIPFVRDISDIVQGHDVTRDDMQLLTNLITNGQKLIEGKGSASTAKNIATFAGTLGDIVGVPASNILKEFDYIFNYSTRALERAGIDTLGVQFWMMQYDKALGKDANKPAYARFIRKIEKAGADQAFIDKVWRMASESYGEDKIKTAVAKVTMKGYADGNNLEDYYAALLEAQEKGNKEAEADIRRALELKGKTDEEEINKGIGSAMVAKYSEGANETDRFYDLYLAQSKGDKETAQGIRDGYKKAGKTDDEINKGIRDAIFMKHTGSKSEEKAYDALAAAKGDEKKELEYAFKIAGRTEADIKKGLAGAEIRRIVGTEKESLAYDKWVQLMLKGDRQQAQELRGYLKLYYKSPDSDLIGAMSMQNDIVEAAKAKNAGNDTAYLKTLEDWERKGFDHDMIIKAVNRAINAMKPKTE